MPQDTDNAGDDKLTAAAAAAFCTPFGATLRIDAEDGLSLLVDGAQSPPAIKTLDTEEIADCVWRGAHETLLRALANERAFASAFVAGRITISGDLSVMARLELGAPS
ncbi:MAG: SCP2 sterol-binding domain-containing protein [Pseudomonadota bacterium]